MRSKNIIVRGLKVRFYESGDFSAAARPLIFLHGWGAEALLFSPLFSICRNWLALDLPGFGASDPPPRDWDTAAYARLLEQFLQKLSVKEPLLVGHSFGGKIVIKYCASPRAVAPRKIVLISSAGLAPSSVRLFLTKTAAKILRLPFLLPGLRRFRERARRRFYQRLGAADFLEAGALRGTFRRIVREDLSADLPKVSLPAVLVWGGEDRETPLADGKKMARLLPHAKLYILEKAGHFPFLDCPEEFKKIFLGAVHAA